MAAPNWRALIGGGALGGVINIAVIDFAGHGNPEAYFNPMRAGAPATFLADVILHGPHSAGIDITDAACMTPIQAAAAAVAHGLNLPAGMGRVNYNQIGRVLVSGVVQALIRAGDAAPAVDALIQRGVAAVPGGGGGHTFDPLFHIPAGAALAPVAAAPIEVLVVCVGVQWCSVRAALYSTVPPVRPVCASTPARP